MEFPQDFSDFLSCLHAEGVRYLVVGGYAVCLHGHPRYTGDLDVWIANDLANATRVSVALRRFGFDLPDVKPESFTGDDVIVRMGVEPLCIELFTKQPGVTFTECEPHALVQRTGAVEARFIGLADLKRSKQASGRAKDLADLEELGGPDGQ